MTKEKAITGIIQSVRSKYKKGSLRLIITLSPYTIVHDKLKTNSEYKCWSGDRVDIYFAPTLMDKLKAGFDKTERKPWVDLTGSGDSDDKKVKRLKGKLGRFGSR